MEAPQSPKRGTNREDGEVINSKLAETTGAAVETVKQGEESRGGGAQEQSAESSADDLAERLVEISRELQHSGGEMATAALKQRGIEEPRRTGNWDKDHDAWGEFVAALSKEKRNLFVEMAAAVRGLRDAEQANIAEKFYADTIGRDIGANRAAYPIYQELKGSPFAQKFKELEDARLVAAGFAPLAL